MSASLSQKTPQAVRHRVLESVRAFAAANPSTEAIQQLVATMAEEFKSVAIVHDAMVDLFGALDDTEITEAPEMFPGTLAELDSLTVRRVG